MKNDPKNFFFPCGKQVFSTFQLLLPSPFAVVTQSYIFMDQDDFWHSLIRRFN